MDVVDVRQLLNFSPKEILDELKTDLNLLLEDNTVYYAKYKEITILRYLLELHKITPQIKITSKYMLRQYYVNEIFTSKTIAMWLDTFLKEFIEIIVKPNNNRELLVPIYKAAWDIMNNIYNEVVFNCLEYSSSISIEDLLEIQLDENLIKAMQDVEIKQSPEAVNKTYDILEDIIYNKKSIKDNPIVKGYISKSINNNQVKQLLASRGYVTEINNHIFKKPIASNFTLGMQSIYDMAIESRSGAKALFVSNRAIQISEYLARELQLVTMVVERLVDGDCGSKNYMDWYMHPGNDTHKPDLPNMLGIKFVNPETGQEDNLRMEHKNLVNGKTIKIRTALSCELKNPRHICTGCFGDIAYSIPLNTNLGHFCTTELTEQASQGILSTKHLVSSASSSDIVLDEVSREFFNVKDGHKYYFKAPNNKYIYKVAVSQEEGFGIKDLNSSVDVNKLNILRVSRIHYIHIYVYQDDNVIKTIPIEIKQGNKYGSFSQEFLHYIINNGYKLNDIDNFVIDLSKWDNKKPFIIMPDIEYDYLTLVKQIIKELKHMETDGIGIGFETPESLLQKLFNLVSNKLSVNLIMLSVIVYAFTAKDPDNGNYSLARGIKNKRLAKMEAIMRNRSLGAGYGWEFVIKTILSPRSYASNNAVDHPMDVLLAPNEVVNKHFPNKR